VNLCLDVPSHSCIMSVFITEKRDCSSKCLFRELITLFSYPRRHTPSVPQNSPCLWWVL